MASDEHCNLCHEEHEIQRIEVGEMKIRTCPHTARYGDQWWIGLPECDGKRCKLRLEDLRDEQ